MNSNSFTNKFVNEILEFILKETNKEIFQKERMKKKRTREMVKKVWIQSYTCTYSEIIMKKNPSR